MEEHLGGGGAEVVGAGGGIGEKISIFYLFPWINSKSEQASAAESKAGNQSRGKKERGQEREAKGS